MDPNVPERLLRPYRRFGTVIILWPKRRAPFFTFKTSIEFRIIFQNICITFPLCSREHASSILESIAASPMVAGRAVR
jgi:hypothetical protein